MKSHSRSAIANIPSNHRINKRRIGKPWFKVPLLTLCVMMAQAGTTLKRGRLEGGGERLDRHPLPIPS